MDNTQKYTSNTKITRMTPLIDLIQVRSLPQIISPNE